MSYQIIEKENGLSYLLFEEKEYWIWYQQGKFLGVEDKASESFSNKNIFNLETEKFFFKEWVYYCWFRNFGIGIFEDRNSARQSKPNFFSYEARCKVFKENLE